MVHRTEGRMTISTSSMLLQLRIAPAGQYKLRAAFARSFGSTPAGGSSGMKPSAFVNPIWPTLILS
jgi:hypothetical protein